MSQSTQRQRVIQIKLSLLPEESERLARDAENSGMLKNGKVSKQDYILAKVFDKPVKPPIINREGAMKIAEQLRRIGVNVNQIARNVNMCYIDDCSRELAEINVQITKVLKMLVKMSETEK